MDERVRRRRDPVAITSIVLAASVVLAVVRVGVQAVRHQTVVFMPDLWETLLGAQSAGAGRQLVGAWSRLGLYHPGPAWFWWAAPFVRLTGGHPSGLALAASVLAATAIAVAFGAARSATTPVGSLVVAAILAFGVGQWSTEGLAVPWNPTIVIAPITAGLVCVAVVAVRGTTWPAVAAVLFGTLVAQAHLGTLPIGIAIVVGALAAWLVGDRRTGASPPRWHGWLLLVALVLPWVPAAIDQVTGVGNAATVARYAATGSVDERFPSEPTGPSDDLSVTDALRQLGSISSLTQERTAIWAGAGLDAGRTSRPSPTSTIAALALVGVALAAARPQRWRQGSTDVLGSWICRAALVGLALQVAAALKVRHEFRPYLVAGAAGVGLALWIGVGLVGLQALRTSPWFRNLSAGQRTTARRTGAVAVVLGSLVAVATFAGSIQGYRFERPGDGATEARVVAAIGDQPAQIRIDGVAALQPAMTLTARLEEQGTRLAVRGRYRSHFSDLQRSAPVGPPATEVWVVPPDRPAPEGCTAAGTYQGAEVCVVR